jgi:hypothetical protein
MVRNSFLVRLFVFLNFIYILSACTSTQLIRDVDYRDSQISLNKSDPEKALFHFPTKENQGFITSIEKSWISLWSGMVNQGDLLRQAHTLDERKFTSITRETEHFFFNETQEGYLPSEHEIITMHLISAMNFMELNQYEEAFVEAKAATYFLQSIFNDDQHHFDDPAIRIWLAGIWTALGEWDEARVDFRRIYELTGNKKALAWSERATPPPELNIIFQGSGPELKWQKESPIPDFHIKEADTYAAGNLSYSSEAWYARHKVRNNAIREQILKSNYMSQYYGIQFGKKSEEAVGFMAGSTLKITGIIVGTVIIAGAFYLVIQSGVSGGGEFISYMGIAAMGMGKYFWDEGTKLANQFDESARALEQRGLNDLRTYRFVRFLPNWVTLAEYQAPSKWFRTLHFQGKKSMTKVHFIQRF